MIRSLLTSIVLSASLHVSAIDLLFSVQHATCGADTGHIYMSITNGVAPFSISWSDGSTGTMLIGVQPGIYTVTVTDANGDSVTEDVEVLELNELFPTFGGEAYSCTGGCDGSFYQFVPLPMSNYTITFDPPGPVGGANPNGIYFNELCAGVEYTATITSENGCTGIVGPITVAGPFQPQLLSTTVTGSCPNGATGSVTLVFDQVTMLYITGPDSTNMPPVTNPYTANNLAPGVYTGMAWGDINVPGGGTSCYLSFTFEIPVSPDPCGTIAGTVFADLNGDCDQDAGEPSIPYQVISLQPGDYFVLTDSAGNYSTELPFGSYLLEMTPDDYTIECATMPVPFTLSLADPSTAIDIALDPVTGPDVSSFVSIGAHVPGFNASYWLNAQNNGPYTFNGLLLDFYFDPMLTPVSTSGSPVLVSAGHYQWSIPELGPFGMEQFTVVLNVPPNAALIGTEVTATSTVVPDPADAVPDNDSYIATRTIVGAYDPNDKAVVTSSRLSGSEYFIDVDDWVDYTIRFQNTGTAPAINVFLLDTIAVELDMMSLQMLGSSHSFNASIEDGRVLRFDFPGIMLPDSSADLMGSQGYVSFRMKPIDGLMLGTLVSNEADIYFDFNEPIRTNAAELMIDITVGMDEGTVDQIGVFPNPAQDMIILDLGSGSWNIDLIGVDGRIVHSQRSNVSNTVMQLQNIAPGLYSIRATEATGRTAVASFVKQ